MLDRFKALPAPILLTVLLALRLIAAARGGLVPDETYYWLWAQHPSFGYYDHPPMVAWWIGASTTLFGSSAFAVRLPFVLSFVALGWVVYDATKSLFDRDTARRAVVWLNACLLLSIGTVIATPDPPSVLMWALGLWALARLVASRSGLWWLAFGLFAGLGVEAKYTNLFLGVGVVLWVALDRDARKWLRTPWPYLGAVVAVAAMAPNLLWNAQHHWLTIDKQFGRIAPAGFTVKYLIEFLVSQPLLLNPLIFVFVVTGVLAWWKARGDRALTLLVALPAPLVVYMLIHVFHDRIQGNWTAPLFPGLIVLATASASGETSSKALNLCRQWATGLGVALSGIALFVLALGAQAPRLPGAASAGLGWDKLAQKIADIVHQTGAQWIATVDYDTEGELSYHLPKQTVTAFEERDRYAWPSTDAAHLTDTAIIVIPANRHPDLTQCFDGLNDLGAVARSSHGGARDDFHLYAGRLRTAGCQLTEPVSAAGTPAAPHAH